MDVDIKALRIAAGMTQAQLGWSIGVSVRTISRWEQGVSIPNPFSLAAAIQVIKAKIKAASAR